MLKKLVSKSTLGNDHPLFSIGFTNNTVGMHDPNITEGVSDFEKEMRRRVWCILGVWDR